MQPLRRRMHVRAGSEGYEVRPTMGWQAELHSVDQDDPEGTPGARPWEEDGRYQVYESEPFDDNDDWDE